MPCGPSQAWFLSVMGWLLIPHTEWSPWFFGIFLSPKIDDILEFIGERGIFKDSTGLDCHPFHFWTSLYPIQPPTLQCQTLSFCLHFDAFLGRLQFGTHFTTFFVVVAAQIPLSHPLAVFWLPFLLLKQAQSVCSVQQTSNQTIFPSPPPPQHAIFSLQRNMVWL